MPLTGKLGTHDSKLGNFQLGSPGGPNLNPHITQAITFTQSNHLTHNQNVTQTLTFTQIVSFLDQHVSHTLHFTQSADHSVIEALSQTLTFSQSVVDVHPVRVSASNTLTFTQTTHETPISLTPTNTLTFVQVVALDRSIRNLSVTQTLTFNSSISYFTPRGEALTQTLVFTQEGRELCKFEHVPAQTLTFTQSAVHTIILHASNTLTFTQQNTKQYISNPHITQTLPIIQTFSYTFQHNLSVTQTLRFQTSFTRPLPVFNQQISGQQGQQAYFPVIPASYVVFNPKRCFVLLSVPSFSIVLRCPEFGDSETSTGEINLKQTMTNITYVYVRKPTTRKLRYLFHLDRQKALQLEDFLVNFGTQQMSLTNHKGEVWLVNCTTNPYQFTAEERYLNAEERVDISLDFEGILVMGGAGSCET